MRTRIVALLLSISILFLATFAFAVPSHLWSKRFGSTGTDGGQAVALDAAGNVFVSGTFSGTVNFGGGDLISAGNQDAFVAKYDAAGTHVWSKRYGSTLVDFGRELAVDASGNAYLAGFYSGTVDFGGGPLMSAGGLDVFVLKLDASGGFLWSKRLGSTSNDECEGLALDNAGNIVITGYFSGSVDFGGGPIMSAGNQDIFLAKYDANGAHVWSRRVGGTAYDYASAVACDLSGNVALVGYFLGSADFGGGFLMSAGDADIFVAKYDPSGTHVWSRRYGSIFRDEGYAVDTDPSGRVLAAGAFRLTVDFGGGGLVSSGNLDMFALQLDAAGTHQWSRRFGDSANDGARAIVDDGYGGVFLTGYFNFFVDFGGGEFVANGATDTFLAKFNDAGVHQWSATFGDTQADEGSALASRAGLLLATGSFSQSVNFGGGALNSAGGPDVYFLKYDADSATPVSRSFATARLGDAYPNPFNPSTSIPFSLAREVRVTLRVYDVNGAPVATLLDERRGAGDHTARWNGRNDVGAVAPTGIYFARLETNGATESRKLVLLK